jgi:hypothetical protein
MDLIELTNHRTGPEHKQEPSKGLQVNDNVMLSQNNKASCIPQSCELGDAETSSDDDSLDNPFVRKSPRDSIGKSHSSSDLAISTQKCSKPEGFQQLNTLASERQTQYAEVVMEERAGKRIHHVSGDLQSATSGLEDVEIELPNEEVIAKAVNESPEFPLPAEKLGLDSFKVRVFDSYLPN